MNGNARRNNAGNGANACSQPPLPPPGKPLSSDMSVVGRALSLGHKPSNKLPLVCNKGATSGSPRQRSNGATATSGSTGATSGSPGQQKTPVTQNANKSAQKPTGTPANPIIQKVIKYIDANKQTITEAQSPCIICKTSNPSNKIITNDCKKDFTEAEYATKFNYLISGKIMLPLVNRFKTDADFMEFLKPYLSTSTGGTPPKAKTKKPEAKTKNPEAKTKKPKAKTKKPNSLKKNLKHAAQNIEQVVQLSPDEAIPTSVTLDDMNCLFSFLNLPHYLMLLDVIGVPNVTTSGRPKGAKTTPAKDSKVTPAKDSKVTPSKASKVTPAKDSKVTPSKTSKVKKVVNSHITAKKNKQDSDNLLKKNAQTLRYYLRIYIINNIKQFIPAPTEAPAAATAPKPPAEPPKG